MTVRKCLALRVLCFQTINKYQKRKRSVNDSMDQMVYQPIGLLNDEEQKLLPGAANFQLQSNDSDCFESAPGTEPIDIMAGLKMSNPGFQLLNLAGFRWRYDQAIAQTLIEYNIVI